MQKILDNERFVSEMQVIDIEKMSLADYQIIITVNGQGTYFDMPDTRLRISILDMQNGVFSSIVRKHIFSEERPETKKSKSSGKLVKFFTVESHKGGQFVRSDFCLDEFIDVTDSEIRKIKNNAKQNNRIASRQPTNAAEASSTETDPGVKVLSEPEHSNNYGRSPSVNEDKTANSVKTRNGQRMVKTGTIVDSSSQFGLPPPRSSTNIVKACSSKK